MRQMTIKDILDIIKKHWIFLVVIPLLAGAVTHLYYRDRQQPQPTRQYTASARLYVLMDYVDQMGQVRYDTAASSQLASDFKELIQTRQIFQETADRLGGDISMMDDVQVDISAVSGTRVLAVSATSASPVLSMNVANTISQVFVEHITRILKTGTVSIAAEATLPEAQSSPASPKNATTRAALLALMLAAGVFFILEMFNTKIKTVQEAEQILQIPVLASIPDYRNVISRYMKNPDAAQPWSEAVSPGTMEGVKTLSANLQFGRAGDALGAIMVTSALSTDGKSTLTLLLAEALAEEGFHVLVCDFDVKFSSLGQYVGRRNPLDIIDYLAGKATFGQIVTQTRKPNVSFMDCIHRDHSISQMVKHPGFARFLEEAKRDFSVVLLDTSPLGMFVDAAMLSNLVDGALVVLGAGMVERGRAQGVLGQLKRANANLLGVALNYAPVSRRAKLGYDKQERQRPKSSSGRVPAPEEMHSDSREE